MSITLHKSSMLFSNEDLFFEKQEAEASCFLKNLVYLLNLTESQHHFISKTIPKKV